MTICPKCYQVSAVSDTRCQKCGASLVGITEKSNKEVLMSLRHKQRMRGHMITGVILCFGLPTLFGLPGSLFPIELLKNIVFGVVFGAPLGFLVAKYTSSIIGGALIGCAIGTVYCVITFLFLGIPVTAMAILFGVITGLLPGAIMGLHVSMEN